MAYDMHMRQTHAKVYAGRIVLGEDAIFFAKYGADVMTIILGLFGLLFVLFVLIPLVLVLLVRSTYRRVRRDPRWSRMALVVQEKTNPPGPRRSLSRMRVRLHDATASARAAAAFLQQYASVQGELASLIRRLDPVADALDAQLRLMQSEPDPYALHDLLIPLHNRVAAIEQIARQIRSAAYAAIGGDMEENITMITADVAREIAALQAGMHSLRATAMDLPTPMGLPVRKGSDR
jgi:ABC-type multidrug transport system fused ATPase/permease subunit